MVVVVIFAGLIKLLILPRCHRVLRQSSEFFRQEARHEELRALRLKYQALLTRPGGVYSVRDLPQLSQAIGFFGCPSDQCPRDWKLMKAVDIRKKVG
jgi:hypothetical protein